MKTCPICNAKTFDDARICFGCLHDFEKPVINAPRHASGVDQGRHSQDSEHESCLDSDDGADECDFDSAQSQTVSESVVHAECLEDVEQPCEVAEEPRSICRGEEIESLVGRRDPYDVLLRLDWKDDSATLSWEGDYSVVASASGYMTVNQDRDNKMNLTFTSQRDSLQGTAFVKLRKSDNPRVMLC